MYKANWSCWFAYIRNISFHIIATYCLAIDSDTCSWMGLITNSWFWTNWTTCLNYFSFFLSTMIRFHYTFISALLVYVVLHATTVEFRKFFFSFRTASINTYLAFSSTHIIIFSFYLNCCSSLKHRMKWKTNWKKSEERQR